MQFYTELELMVNKYLSDIMKFFGPKLKSVSIYQDPQSKCKGGEAEASVRGMIVL